MRHTPEIKTSTRLTSLAPVLIEVQLDSRQQVVLVSKTKGIDPNKIEVMSGQTITWSTAVLASQLLLLFRSDHKPVPGTVYLGGMDDPITLTARGNKDDQFKYAVGVITEPNLPTDRSLNLAVADPVIIIR